MAKKKTKPTGWVPVQSEAEYVKEKQFTPNEQIVGINVIAADWLPIPNCRCVLEPVTPSQPQETVELAVFNALQGGGELYAKSANPTEHTIEVCWRGAYYTYQLVRVSNERGTFEVVKKESKNENDGNVQENNHGKIVEEKKVSKQDASNNDYLEMVYSMAPPRVYSEVCDAYNNKGVKAADKIFQNWRMMDG